MRHVRFLLTTAALAGMALPALADQCAWISKEQVTHAFDLLRPGMMVVEFCEPCGDPRPGARFLVEKTEIVHQENQYYTLLLNGKEVDLAYLYVKASDGTFHNMASLAGCQAEGVTDVFPSNWIEETTRKGVIHKMGRVDSRYAQWQETGLYYEPGDALVIRSSGEIQVGGWGGKVGPDAEGAGALELRIGDGQALKIGRQFVFSGPTLGPVYLRVKDTQHSDNQGFYEVQFMQIPAPLIPSAEEF